MRVKKILLTAAIVCLLALASVTAFGCQKKETPTAPPPPTAITMTLSYDATSGTLSWDAVEGAVKYTVYEARYGEDVVTKETATCSIALTLRKGTTRLTVTAYGASDVELGVGSTVVTLDIDFGAPAMPSDLVYHADTGKLTWTAVENATVYTVRGEAIAGDAFVDGGDVTAPEKQLPQLKGVYTLAVCARDALGRTSAEAEIEYRSYTDAHFCERIGESDFYRVLDFEEVGVLDVTRPSDFKEWGEISSCEYSISDKVYSTTAIDADEDGVSDKNENGNTVYEEVDVSETYGNVLKLELKKSQNGERYFAGVTFNLQEKITDFGRLYFDVFACYTTVGVMVDDGEGHRASIGSEYVGDNQFTWKTMTMTRSKILTAAPEFTGIKEITFYFRNADGNFIFFDNVRYDTADLGDVGNLSYSKHNARFTWDKVESATEYEVYVGGATTPLTATTNSLDLDTPLTEGQTYTVKLVAKNGLSKKEKTFEVYVDKDIRFNVPLKEGSPEYVLAQFDTREYLEYLTPNTWQAPTYSIDTTNEELNIKYKASWRDGALNYTLPTVIDGKDVYKLHVRFKLSDPYKQFMIDIDDGSGSPAGVGFIGNNVKEDSDGYRYVVIDMTKLKKAVGQIKGLKFFINDTASTVTIGTVTYEKYPETYTGNITLNGEAFPTAVFSDTKFDLTKLGMGVLPEGRLTATLTANGGEAQTLDLTQTEYTFAAGTYTLTLQLSNSVTTGTASVQFTVNKPFVYTKEDGTVVLGDFDTDYYLDAVTVAEGGTKTIGHYDENGVADDKDNNAYKGATGGALKLIIPQNKGWEGGLAKYSIGQTVTLEDGDTVSIKLYAMDCWKTVIVYFPKADGTYYKASYDGNVLPWKAWTEITFSKQKLKDNDVTSFDWIGFSIGDATSADDGSRTIFVDEINIVKA